MDSPASHSQTITYKRQSAQSNVSTIFQETTTITFIFFYFILSFLFIFSFIYFIYSFFFLSKRQDLVFYCELSPLETVCVECRSLFLWEKLMGFSVLSAEISIQSAKG